MKKALIAIIALGFLTGCAAPIKISQTGTSGGKPEASVPGGNVINISVIVTKKEDMAEAVEVLGDAFNILPGLADEAARKIPDVPDEEVAEPEGPDENTLTDGQGDFEES